MKRYFNFVLRNYELHYLYSVIAFELFQDYNFRLKTNGSDRKYYLTLFFENDIALDLPEGRLWWM